MEACVWISLEVTAVIVKQDIRETIVKQVTVTYDIVRETEFIEPCIK